MEGGLVMETAWIYDETTDTYIKDDK